MSVYRMHHEIDDWKLAGAFGLGMMVMAFAVCIAAVLWQVSQNVQVG
jgi:hypothetical protein